MNEPPDPIAIQSRLAMLLDRARSDQRVEGELARARREFFGADQPAYARDDDEREAAAVRFAEWFVLERPSDVMGEVPFASLTRDAAVIAEDDALAQSRAGLFLTETSGKEPVVRDLESGERLPLVELPLRLRAGDLLVGRIFPASDGRFVPSAVLTILPGAAQLAVAFQRDVRQLGLDRRLTQAELERLVFRQRAIAAQTPEADQVPLERLEAELQSLLDAHGKGAGNRATRITDALTSAPRPGVVLGPLLDEMAFDTEIDLDRLREIGVRIWSAQHQPEPDVAEEPAPSPAAPPSFRSRPGETLGEQLARRIEEGLSDHEDLDQVFADVERMLGESVDEDDQDSEPIVDPEVGDLPPLLREFAWELGLPAEDTSVLDEFVQQQAASPIPRLNVEYVEPDDYLRFLLRIWLDAPPDRREQALGHAFAVLERFHDWLFEAQSIDLRDRLVTARESLVEPSARLQAASLALSTSHRPGDGDASAFTLLRVDACDGDRIHVVAGDRRRELTIDLPAGTGAQLREGDFLFGALREPPGGGGARLFGMVVVVPAAVEHLLG